MAVTATIDSNSGTNTVVGSTSQGRTNIVVKAGAEAATTIVNLTDVDATTVGDGSILMYNGTTNKFTTTTTIEPAAGGTITINGGNF
tara:strand:- start:501 stop:761 length:261 start_codon:yes stop_codon:yes gene_type:complete